VLEIDIDVPQPRQGPALWIPDEAATQTRGGSVTHHLRPGRVTHQSESDKAGSARHVRTFYTSSSRADTARTRRRLLRPALAPAPLRERAGRLARDTGLWLCRGGVREREARIVRSRPPSVKPAARPDPTGPSVHRSFGGDRRRGMQVTSGGAGRIGSERLDPGAPTTPRPAVAGRPGACRR
jgi:hypothetical protein